MNGRTERKSVPRMPACRFAPMSVECVSVRSSTCPQSKKKSNDEKRQYAPGALASPAQLVGYGGGPDASFSVHAPKSIVVPVVP